LEGVESEEQSNCYQIADYLAKKSVWIVGGDGWAYDIGYGGLDHVLASGKNVNVLVMDTEVYSNTGGQTSKATPIGAVAKFSASGKPIKKKDLGMIAMAYESVYVAVVAFGSKDEQTLKAFIEAEAFDGPSIIIAYSHCIAHGIDMSNPLQNQKAAVDSGQWILYRYNPDKIKLGENPLTLDSKPRKTRIEDYMMMENRFKMLMKSKPALAKKYMNQAQKDAEYRWKHFQYLAAREGEKIES
jgi:pyruvate-ferredoxin/flavodoxin oxidoreductase